MKPRILDFLRQNVEDTVYSRVNNPIEVVKEGDTLVYYKGIEIQDKAILTFKSPCSCQGITKLELNAETYDLVNSLGENLSGLEYFAEGVAVSVIIDTTGKKAYIMNAAELVGRKSPYEGEILGDYDNNLAGSKAFTIINVEKDRACTNDEIKYGYDGVFIPATKEYIEAVYGDTAEYAFYKSHFPSLTIESDWSTKYNADDGNPIGVTPYIEARSGALRVSEDAESLNLLAQYHRMNMCLQLVQDNDVFSGTEGKSFIYTTRVKRGSSKNRTPVDGNEISFSQFTCAYLDGTTKKRCLARTIFSSLNGELYVYDSNEKKKVIYQLDCDNFAEVTVFARPTSECLRYDVYINGIKVVHNYPAYIRKLNNVYWTMSDYSKFALATVSCTTERENLDDTDTDPYFIFDSISLYFADSYQFGLSGAYTLDDVTGLSIGDEYSVSVSYKPNSGHGSAETRENYGKILGIDTENNKVYVDRLFCNGEFRYLEDLEDSDYNVFRVIAKPHIGSRILGKHAIAGGRDNKSLNKGSLSFGSGNTSAGAWSGTIGINLFAAYSAFAINGSNKARAQNSFAGGVLNEVESQAYAGAVLGYGNIVRLSYEFIVGEFARLDDPDPAIFGRGKYLFKVGNGTDKDNRSDAFTVDRAGNATASGDMYTHDGKLASEKVLLDKFNSLGSLANKNKVYESDLATALKDKIHTHSNKSLLDTYNQTNSNLADAVTKKHSHSNATELARIANGDKAKWDANVISKPSGITDGAIVVYESSTGGFKAVNISVLATY